VSDEEQKIYGLMRGVVTANQDAEDKLGRVQVTFVGLPGKVVSDWARISTPLAGKDYGLCVIPNIGDEVLVMFENGDVDKPYITGIVWNGKNLPPYSNADGNNDMRQIKSRSGHLIMFNDNADKPMLVIQDSTGNNKITFDSSGNTITVESAKDFKLVTKGAVSVEATGDFSVKCANFKVDASTGVDIKGSASLNLTCRPGIALNNDGLVVK
jgi:uncharacterized protein involved in type VI secretion and phage assembly